MPNTYSFACGCGVTITTETERQLEALIKRHYRDSFCHKTWREYQD